MVKERLIEFLEYLGIGQLKFEESVGLSRGHVNKIGDNITLKSLNRIKAAYPQLNINWLQTGDGLMLLSSDSNSEKSIPYWNLPVAAGKGIVDIIGSTKPDGFIKGLPGADLAENILPVIGTSMEPEISDGAIIGVRKMTNWDTLNTARIYLIITKDDRMIKRIEHDSENEEILWCVSPNYPRFKIFKSDIIEIQRVCFVYNAK